MKRIIDNLRYFKFVYVFHLFLIVILFVPARMFKLVSKNKVWIISDSPREASDCGYHLFKYIKSQKLININVYFAIDFKCKDYKTVSKLGKCINYYSISHFFLYLSADKVISSQKACNPSPATFYFLHMYNLLNVPRFFLQHGVIKDDLEWLHYKNTKFNMFVCSSQVEYDYVCSNYGYPENVVQLLGLARFDNLYDFKVNEKQILVMPTWRSWLSRVTKASDKFGEANDFANSQYCKKWNEFLNDKRINDILLKYGYKMIFYPHRNMQTYLHLFSTTSKNIIIASSDKFNVQSLLKESKFLITDYSSVFFDFVYMKKRVLFYQFDYDKFRIGQYKEGYLNYADTKFGVCNSTLDGTILDLEKYMLSDFDVSDSDFESYIIEFFGIMDNNNSERILNALLSYNK